MPGFASPVMPAPAGITFRFVTSSPCGAIVNAVALALAMLLGGCASGPSSSPATTAPPKVRPGPASPFEKDGADPRPPADLDKVPDAEPRIEPVRKGGPNKPYEVMGRDHVPMRGDPPFVERGLASWYGRKFHGRRTASGEVYNMYAMTAAHKTMPIPSYARVRNPKNGREVIVRINDRGPFHSTRVIDLSYTAASKLGVLNGVTTVEIERITQEQIRTGSWRRPGDAAGPVIEAKADPATDTLAAAPKAAAVSPPPKAGGETLTAAGDPPAEPSSSSSSSSAATSAAAPVALADGGASAAGTSMATGTPGATTSSGADPAPAATASTASIQPGAAGRFWLQLGAFRQREGAEQFHRQVSENAGWLAPLLAVFSEPSLFRLQAGPYASRGEAQSALERVRDVLKLVPVIVERRR